jgi:molybdopterin-guanine dinucleotide biosynthesis protein A
MNPKSSTSAVILAGGMGRRMGGRDKGLVELGGRPLIAHVIDAVAPQVGQLYINANRNRESYARFGWPVIADDLEGYQGPLAGILTAMRRATTPLLLVVPCDAPRLPDDLLEQLARTLEAESAEIAVAHDGNRLQPVHALLSTALADDLEIWLAAGERKIDNWYRTHAMAIADFSRRPEIFTNVNTPEERKTLEERKLIR